MCFYYHKTPPELLKNCTAIQVLEMYEHSVFRQTGKTIKELMKDEEILDDAKYKETLSQDELEDKYIFDPTTGGLIKKDGRE